MGRSTRRLRGRRDAHRTRTADVFACSVGMTSCWSGKIVFQSFHIDDNPAFGMRLVYRRATPV